MEETQTKFPWKQLVVVLVVVLATAGVVGGGGYYYYGSKLKDEKNKNTALENQINELKEDNQATKAIAEEKGEIEDQLLVKVKAISDKYMATRTSNEGKVGSSYLEPAYITKLGMTQADAPFLFTTGASGVIAIQNYSYVGSSKIATNQYKFTYNTHSVHQDLASDSNEDVYLELVNNEWKVYRDSLWDGLESRNK